MRTIDGPCQCAQPPALYALYDVPYILPVCVIFPHSSWTLEAGLFDKCVSLDIISVMTRSGVAGICDRGCVRSFSLHFHFPFPPSHFPSISLLSSHSPSLPFRYRNIPRNVHQFSMAFWPYEFAMGFPWRTHGLYGERMGSPWKTHGKFIWPKSHGKLMDVSWDISVTEG